MMLFKHKIILLLILPLLLILFSVNYGQAAAFDLFGSQCNGNKAVGSTGKTSAVCEANNNARNSNSNNNVVLHTINVAANIIALVAGLIAVIMIMVAGFSYVLAGGNAEETKKARNRIVYAAVGLVIITVAWTITRFITDKVL
jgi:hypothetical protein